MPLVKLLPSGYWHVRWSANRWFQWPLGRAPRLDDGFGWVNESDRLSAELFTTSAERRRALEETDRK